MSDSPSPLTLAHVGGLFVDTVIESFGELMDFTANGTYFNGLISHEDFDPTGANAASFVVQHAIRAAQDEAAASGGALAVEVSQAVLSFIRVLDALETAADEGLI